MHIQNNMINFLKIKSPPLDLVNKFFSKSIEKGFFTNFGPNEQELTQILEGLTGRKTICTANATLILDGLHHILSQVCTKAYLPSFTFPATNLGCRISYTLSSTTLTQEGLGFAEFDVREDKSYAITTAPFGAAKPENYVRPNTTFWIVDNAGGTSPTMNKVNAWLEAGADVVICSLHATKILTGCEGGFAVFNNKALYDMYRKYIVFGFYLDENLEKKSMPIGSNHKMSELTAAYILAYYHAVFEHEYAERTLTADAYQNFCENEGVPYIYSPQAFWLQCKSNAFEVSTILEQKGIETRPYYQQLFSSDKVDPGAKILSLHGLCLPTYGMEKSQISYVLNNLRGSI
jgi:dTDP-4-amino-4,6-dideoxygalactose transaminase